MYVPKITNFRTARIMDIAKQGATMSYISKETGIPFTTVRNIIHEFEDIGVIKVHEYGKKRMVRVSNTNHKIVKSMTEIARWVVENFWNIDVIIAKRFEKNNIYYAFIGVTKIKYTHNEIRNMIQVAVKKNDIVMAEKIIKNTCSEFGVKVVKDPYETIGKTKSVIYAKCFPVNNIKYTIFNAKISDSDEIVEIKIADDDTEKTAMQFASKEDKMFAFI